MKELKNHKIIIWTVKIFCFFLLLLVTAIVLSVIMRPKDNSEEGGTINFEAKAILAEPEKTVDVIAVGASNFWCGYDPMKVWKESGITSYNTGTLMEEVWYSYYFLKEIYKKQTPKVILLDTDMLFLEDTTTVDNVNSLLKTTLNWKLPVFEYHNRFKSLNKKDFSLKLSYNYHNYMKGFYFQPAKQATKADISDYMNQKFNNEKLTWLNRFYLNKIRKLCQKKGTKLVLVEAPAVLAWNHTRKEEIEAYAGQYNIEFLDANQEMNNIDWQLDTRDGGFHLNYAGAEKFTGYLQTYLKKQAGIKDHRKDQRYRFWDSDYKQYEHKIQEAEKHKKTK